jgi:hypothetical protein
MNLARFCTSTCTLCNMLSFSSEKHADPERRCPDALHKAWRSVHTSKRSCGRNSHSAFLALPTETRIHILGLCFAGAQTKFKPSHRQIRTNCAEAVHLLRVSHQIRSEALDVLFADATLSCVMDAPRVYQLTKIAPDVLGSVRRVSLQRIEDFTETGTGLFTRAFPALQCLEVDMGFLPIRSDRYNQLVDAAPDTIFDTQVGEALLVRAATRLLTPQCREDQDTAVAGMARPSARPSHDKAILLHKRGCKQWWPGSCRCYPFGWAVGWLLGLHKVYDDKDRGFNVAIRGQVDAFSLCACCASFRADNFGVTEFSVVFVVDADRALVLRKTVIVERPSHHLYCEAYVKVDPDEDEDEDGEDDGEMEPKRRAVGGGTCLRKGEGEAEEVDNDYFFGKANTCQHDLI